MLCYTFVYKVKVYPLITYVYHININLKIHFMDRSITLGKILWKFQKCNIFALFEILTLKWVNKDPIYLKYFFSQKLPGYIYLSKKVVWNQYMHQWGLGVQKQLVYSKCTLFKIITLLHLVLLYICAQGQSLYVNYIST